MSDRYTDELWRTDLMLFAVLGCGPEACVIITPAARPSGDVEAVYEGRVVAEAEAEAERML